MRCITFDFLGQHRHGTALPSIPSPAQALFRRRPGLGHPAQRRRRDGPVRQSVRALCARPARLDRHRRGEGHADDGVVGATQLHAARRHAGPDRYPAERRPEEIATDEIWECTRLVISDRLGTHAERSDCLSLVLGGAMELMREHGGRELISLSPVPLARTLRQLGFPVRRVGEPYRETDGRSYAMLRMPAFAPAYSIAAE